MGLKAKEVKSKLDLVAEVRKTVDLVPDGDIFRGRHCGDGHSLKVDPERQVWFCFKCKRGGDVFNWIADRFNINIKEDFLLVLRIAARTAGYKLPRKRDRVPVGGLTSVEEEITSF